MKVREVSEVRQPQPPSEKPRGKGFTLIELLVVVAIIGLLISILLPSLSRAKEQARIAKCLSGIRTTVTSAASYLNENDTLVFSFPIGYYIGAEQVITDNMYYTEFIWGGGIPQRKAADWDNYQGGGPFQGGGGDIYAISATERPLNHFITPDVSWDDPARKGLKNPYRRETPMQLPDNYICPSDNTAAVPTVGGKNPPREQDSIFQTWDFWGTSYNINWYWVYCKLPVGQKSAGFLENLAGTAKNGTRGHGASLIRKEQNYGASEFVLFMENQMNYAMEGANPRGAPSGYEKHLPGWHKQENMHAAGFLDGHAEYKYFDTYHIDGPGWTTWPHRPWTGFTHPSWLAFEDN